MRKRTRFAPFWSCLAILLMITSFGCSESKQVETDTGMVPPPPEDIHENLTDLNSELDVGVEVDAGSEPDTGETPDVASLLDTDTGGVPVPDEGTTTDAGTNCYDSEDPLVHYVGNSPEECAVIDYDCMSPFAEHFSDDCGCGCLDICPDEDSSLVSYASKDPQECMVISLACKDEQTAFSNGCGCGCATICENQSNPKYIYVGHSPEECELIDFGCNEGAQDYFFDACGCGCFDKE